MKLISQPTLIKAAGNKTKIIEEFIGNVNSQTSVLSIARMQSPAGWCEPAQRPEFDEYTVVLKGCLTVESGNQTITVKAGQAVMVERGERVKYSTAEDTEYMAVCLPAFSPQTVHRDDT